mmetsp:Transcript_478/g.1140  ORF Transcript_478/g.1140 Transcript_478/m.1140 type:complete len:246 (-) Transcript_478:84-821(-)
MRSSLSFQYKAFGLEVGVLPKNNSASRGKRQSKPPTSASGTVWAQTPVRYSSASFSFCFASNSSFLAATDFFLLDLVLEPAVFVVVAVEEGALGKPPSIKEARNLRQSPKEVSSIDDSSSSSSSSSNMSSSSAVPPAAPAVSSSLSLSRSRVLERLVGRSDSSKSSSSSSSSTFSSVSLVFFSAGAATAALASSGSVESGMAVFCWQYYFLIVSLRSLRDTQSLINTRDCNPRTPARQEDTVRMC